MRTTNNRTESVLEKFFFKNHIIHCVGKEGHMSSQTVEQSNGKMPNPSKNSRWETHFTCVKLLQTQTGQFLDKLPSGGISGLGDSLEAVHPGFT